MRHTIDSMKAELIKARQAGKVNEIKDLLLLIEYLAHGNGRVSADIKAARNRQNQRRSWRKEGRTVRCRVGDVITSNQDSAQTQFTIRRVGQVAYECSSSALGVPTFIPFADARLIPWVDASATLAACDALYHAVCDYCDASEDAATMLGEALSKYELALDGLK